MSISYYTLINKKHHCSKWNIDIYITGKYRYNNSENLHSTKANYVRCFCPIMENLKLPKNKQNKEFSLYRFCDIENECLKAIEFSPVIEF